MNKLKEALIKACNAMAEKAVSMNMKGVAVATVLPKGSEVDWMGEMKVVGSPVNVDGHGWNLVAIAWSKAGEVIASGANSGDPNRQVLMGELNFVGGAYDEADGYKFAFAFSGGLSEDDLLVAQYGIEILKSLILL